MSTRTSRRQQPSRKVALLAMGGTIASSVQAGTGAVPQLSAEQLVAAIPGIENVADLHCRTFRMLPSTDVSLSDLIELAAEIDRLAGEGYDGVVVTHGTDTLEESAFALDLLVQADIPVVVTGAMRHPDLPSPDGPGNLLSAVQVAASGDTAGMGTVVVIDYHVHAARFLRKTHTTSLATFQSTSGGPLGWVHEGHPRLGAQVRRQRTFVPRSDAKLPLVPLYTVTLGDEPAVLSAIAALQPDGLVIEGFGGGHVRPRLVEVIEQINSAAPVVIASRTGAGQILRSTYGTVGGDIDLAARGVLSAGSFDGLKARILLCVVLMSASPADVRDVFTEFVSAA